MLSVRIFFNQHKSRSSFSELSYAIVREDLLSYALAVLAKDHMFLLQSLANDEVKVSKTQRISTKMDLELDSLTEL